jgi:hypothetical protein
MLLTNDGLRFGQFWGNYFLLEIFDNHLFE